MLFNSIAFAIFLPIVFIIYWFFLKSYLKLQNIFLLLASYVFYGWWDWRFLALIIISSFLDYSIGLKLLNEKKQLIRKAMLLVSIIINIGFLAVFKYYNFFIESFVNAFSFFGSHANVNTLNIILPVGISFYTFQTLSYTIDVYKRKLEPTKDVIAFFAFVSFFPQLVAGPIERAKNLLPQFFVKRTFDYNMAADGMRQILWGLFKKIVIADNAAVYVNDIFNNYSDYSGSTLFLGAVLFAFQIYGDFSGYSDIAIGTSRLFGFNIMKNFAFPYFSRNIAEFWRRWHISLSSWFRDYVYIPIGGSKGGNWTRIRNIFIIFIVSGFWHGANWTFLIWGFLNAVYFLPLMLTKKNRNYLNVVAEGRFLPSIKEFFQIGMTFFLTVIAWIFFRSDNVIVALNYIQIVFTKSVFSIPEVMPKMLLILIVVFVVIEWLQRNKEHALQIEHIKHKPIRWSIYYILVVSTMYFMGPQQSFIYFQF